jgi:hypothetical protein
MLGAEHEHPNEAAHQIIQNLPTRRTPHLETNRSQAMRRSHIAPIRTQLQPKKTQAVGKPASTPPTFHI